jgi:hypothetical protein
MKHEKNMNNHIESSDYLYYHYIIMNKTSMILNYICTFGFVEGKNPRVTCKWLQVNVNSTGVLFTYL